MSSADNRQNSATRGQGLLKKPFNLPSHANQLSPAEQSPAPDTVLPSGSGTMPRQSLIKNPLQLSGRTSQPSSTQLPAFPDTDRLPESGAGTPARQSLIKNPLQLAGRTRQPSPTQPLHVPDTDRVSSRLVSNVSPGVTRPLSEPITPISTTSPLPEPITSPRVTQQLPEYRTLTTRPLTHESGALPSYFLTGTTSMRQPVVIPATSKKPSNPQEGSPRQRRWSTQLIVTGLIVLITVSTLLSVVPVDRAGDHLLNPFQSISNLVQTNSGNPSSIAPQDATATVTHQDGYDPANTGIQLNAGSASNHFAFGQCTYYASMRYHQLSGQWVPWLGNAYQWAYEARYFGWAVSSTPKVPSIIVLGPYVQGAGGYGHVAIVESIKPDGSVITGDWNWYGAGGGWARFSIVVFRPGPGVSFVWHP